jgi:ribosome biogenesis protein MAK21
MKYVNFIKGLQGVFNDNLVTTKFKVATTLFELIETNSFEQYRIILESLINKLGDPDYQVASRIIYLTKNYLYKCNKMKMQVILEIERVIYRQNMKERAQYYAFCCLNQIVLTRQDHQVANRLLLIYFSFFKVSCLFIFFTFEFNLYLLFRNLLKIKKSIQECSTQY